VLGALFLLFIFFPLLQWALARLLIEDEQLRYGLIFASLCPIALVAPYFAQRVGADAELSFAVLVTSMILCPLVAPPLLAALAGVSIQINAVPLMKSMLLLVTVPLLLSFLTARYLPTVKALLAPHLGVLNMLLLSVLVFILFGTAVGRINISFMPARELLALLLMVFVQDFGVLLAARALLVRVCDPRTAGALVITLSMKNVAVAAGILLIYDPRASFPAALGFVAHAFLFTFISLFRKSRLLAPR